MTSLYPAETNDGVVTSWIPLTTVYSPSARCSTQFRLNGPSLVAFDPGYGLDIDSRVICAPPAVTTWWEQGRLGQGAASGHTAASIGPLTCPSSWTTVATSVKDKISTNIMCCPPDYYLANGIRGSIAGDCRSDISSGVVVTFASTPLDDSTAWSTATATVTEDSIVGAIAIVGWNIKQPIPTSTSSSSTSSVTSSTSSTTPLPTPSPNTPSITDASSSPTKNPDSGVGTSSGLSTGATIGIGLGVALGVIGIVALLVAIWLIRRKRDRAAAAAGEAQPTVPQVPPKEEDLITWEPHELPHNGHHLELPSHSAQRPPVELYAA